MVKGFRCLSKEKIINEFKIILKEISCLQKSQIRILSKTGVCCDYSTILTYFGTFEKFEIELGHKFVREYKVKWSKQNIINKFIELYKKYDGLAKSDITYLNKNGEFCCENNVIHHFGSLNNFAKIAGIIFLEKHWGSRIGKNEKVILDNIEKEKHIKIDRDVKVSKYWVDGYDRKNNVVYEIDEKHHIYSVNQIKDYIREQKIKEILKCNIIRILDNNHENRIKIKGDINDRFSINWAQSSKELAS